MRSNSYCGCCSNSKKEVVMEYCTSSVLSSDVDQSNVVFILTLYILINQT